MIEKYTTEIKYIKKYINMQRPIILKSEKTSALAKMKRNKVAVAD